MRYVLVGNYGAGNLGDEALKRYFLSAFPEVEWQVVSACPENGEFPRLPFGMRSLFRPWWRTFLAIARADGMVLGGGSLFTDVESPFACLLWWWHAMVARVLRKPVLLAFQGMGPFRTRVGEWCARSVVRQAAFISVRDAASYDRVRSWKLSTKVIQSFDPVSFVIREQKPAQRSQDVLMIIPRRNSDAVFLQRALELRRSRQWLEVRILSLQSDDSVERALCEELRQSFDSPAQVVFVITLDQLVLHIAAASLVLSQRYHGALAALVLGVPVEIVPQRSGDKLAQLRDIALLPNRAERFAELLRSIASASDALRAALHAPHGPMRD